MGFSLKKAIKSVSKAVKSAGKVAGGITNTQKALLKGDFKGAAGGALGTVNTVKDFAKDTALDNIDLASTIGGKIGQTTGLKPLSDVSKNVGAEGTKAVNTYGDTAMDIGANAVTGGTYGLAKQGAEALAQGGIGGLLKAASDSNQLRQLALKQAGSYAGVGPLASAALQGAGALATGGNIKDAALASVGDYAKLNPMYIQGAQALASGRDLKDSAAGIAAQYAGAGKDTTSAIQDLASGRDLKGAIAGQAAKASGMGEDQIKTAKAVATHGAKGLQDQALGKLEKYAGLSKETMDRVKQARELATGGIEGLKSKAMNKAGISPETAKRIAAITGGRGFQSEALGAAGIDPSSINTIRQGTSGLRNKALTMTGAHPAISNFRNKVSEAQHLASNPLAPISGAIGDQAQNMTDEQLLEMKRKYGV